MATTVCQQRRSSFSLKHGVRKRPRHYILCLVYSYGCTLHVRNTLTHLRSVLVSSKNLEFETPRPHVPFTSFLLHTKNVCTSDLYSCLAAERAVLQPGRDRRYFKWDLTRRGLLSNLYSKGVAAPWEYMKARRPNTPTRRLSKIMMRSVVSFGSTNSPRTKCLLILWHTRGKGVT